MVISQSTLIFAHELASPDVLSYAQGMSRETLASNIAALRKHLKLKQEAFAARVGGKQSSVSKWENGGDTPDIRPLSAMATLAGCSVEEFMDRPWSPPSDAAQFPDVPPTRPASANDDTVEIIQLDLSLPMGPGATVDDYIEETPVRFDLDYIRGFTRTPPHRLRLARGVGDSMYPTLVSSDLVWIDSTQTMLNQQDRVWAVSINGAAAIKRLRALKAGRVLVISDNPAIDNYEVEADELLIGGRVIRFARDL